MVFFKVLVFKLFLFEIETRKIDPMRQGCSRPPVLGRRSGDTLNYKQGTLTYDFKLFRGDLKSFLQEGAFGSSFWCSNFGNLFWEGSEIITHRTRKKIGTLPSERREKPEIARVHVFLLFILK